MQILITIIIVALIVFIGLIFWVNSKRHRISEQDQKVLQAHWHEIILNSEKDPKGTILEADKLLDEALRLKGLNGSLGDKLKRSEELFTNINNVWHAHKLRNKIAHQLNFKITPQEAKTALRYFREALKDLGIHV